MSAIRELARILRIGGRVIITVWALEQKSRRFESQDVLIPWQSPKSKNTATSDDEEDDDDFLPPYHAYTYNEDSTHSNSSRSQGDGDSSSLSSSSPSDTCYSFVRRALQVRITLTSPLDISILSTSTCHPSRNWPAARRVLGF